MRPIFLRTHRVLLAPFEPADEADAAAAPWRLLSPGGGGDLVALAALDESGRLVGAVRLEDIDWVRRDAVVASRWRGGDAEAAAALRAVVAYAHDELNLARVEARIHPSDDAMRDVLRGLGFEAQGADAAGERHARALP